MTPKVRNRRRRAAVGVGIVTVGALFLALGPSLGKKPFRPVRVPQLLDSDRRHEGQPRPKIIHRRLDYATRDDVRLSVDLYRTNEETIQPVIVLMHGGAWRRGNKTPWTRLVPRIVRSGYVVLLPDVRLSPPGGVHHFPSSVNDLDAFLRWTRGNVARLGGDPQRVGLVGSSSGGHLALMAAGTPRGRPDAVAAFSPSVDLAALHRRRILHNSIENYLGCVPDACGDLYRRASPLYAMDDRSPPTMLAFSRDDILPRELTWTLIRRLRAMNVRVRPLEFEGTVHGLKLVPRSLGPLLHFFKQHL